MTFTTCKRKLLKCCAWVGFEPELCNVENVTDRANASNPCAMAAVGDQCISTRTQSVTHVLTVR